MQQLLALRLDSRTRIADLGQTAVIAPPAALREAGEAGEATEQSSRSDPQHHPLAGLAGEACG
jgi:hypothetical protein